MAPSAPSPASIQPLAASSASAPPTARRRAGRASAGGVSAQARPPALAAALAAKTAGSRWRARAQTGTEVWPSSTAVYVARTGPRSPAAAPAARPRRGARPVTSDAAAAAAAPPNSASVHEPTLIGDGGRKTRSMFAKRSGRPRSEIRSRGLTAAPAAAATRALRASRRCPARSAARPRTAEAPARPPTKKYTGTSQVQTGRLRTGRPGYSETFGRSVTGGRGSSDGDRDVAGRRVGLRYRDAVLLHATNVHLDGAQHALKGLFRCPSCCHAAGKVGRICAVVAVRPLQHDEVPDQSLALSHLTPAWVRILRHSPGGRSSLGLPAIVTRPCLWGCLDCR